MLTASNLLPKSKLETEKVERLLALDSALIAPHLSELSQWLQDINWPVARPIAEYFAKRPTETLPHVRDTLRTQDWTWTYNTIVYVIDHWPREAVAFLQDELERLANHSILDVEEADIVALRLLAKHQLGDPEVLRRLLRHKLMGAKGILEELYSIEKVMNRDG